MLANEAPTLGRALADAIAASWLKGAAQGAVAIPEPAPETSSANWLDVLLLSSPQPDQEPVIRWPGAEAAERVLRSRRIIGESEAARLQEETQLAGMQAAQRATDTLAEALASEGMGGTLAGFARRVREILGESTLAPHRIESIYRTSVAQAHAQGLHEVLGVPEVAAGFPYVMSEPIRDSRLSDLCRIVSKSGIQGTNVFRTDDPVWQRYRNPRHPNCRCATIPLSIADAAARGIREAVEWERTGEPPASPAWVPEPKADLPAGWRPGWG